MNRTSKLKIYGSLFFIYLFCSSTISAQLYTKLQWMPQDNVWGVFVKTDSTVTPSQNILLGSGQFTVVAPTGFEIENMTSYMGTWVQNARAIAPVENPEKDYISFGIRLSESVTQLGLFDEVLVLTFSTSTGNCPSTLFLIENDDPFVTTSPNSLNTNPGNDLQMVDLGSGRAIYKYFGNYDLDSWDCNESSITTSVKDFERKQMVKVFPNPFQEELIFELIDKGNRPNLQIQLNDNLGRTIHSQKMENTRVNVAISAENALYYYQIIDLDNNEVVESGKLFKR